MIFVRKYLFVKRLIRILKKEFSVIYKTDYYGSYYLNIRNLVIVIIFKTEYDLNKYKHCQLVDEIFKKINVEFGETFGEPFSNILFISEEFIKSKYNGNYWMYYKEL